MALAAVIDTIEGLEPPLAALYKQSKDGKFRLDVEGVIESSKHDETVNSLNADAARNRKEVDRLKKLLPQDFDPDEWKRLREDAAKREEEAATKRGEWESLKKQMEERHQTEMAAATKRGDDAIADRDRYLLDEAALREIAAADGIADILLPYIKTRARVSSEGGKTRVEVLDAEGHPEIMDGKGTPKTLKHLIDELKGHETFGVAFRASRAGGGGSQAGSGSGGGRSGLPQGFENLPPEERLKVAYQQKANAARTGS